MAKIAINAGHYLGAENYDPGAVNTALGLTEAGVNVSVARKVEAILKSRGHEVVYIHKGELYEITNASNAAKADVFVSIHCNAATNQSANGVETFCHASSVNGRNLATQVQKQLVACLKLTDRGVKTNSLYVTNNTTAVAILVELGFISNFEEAKLLSNAAFQDKAAAAIAQGVLDYLFYRG